MSRPRFSRWIAVAALVVAALPVSDTLLAVSRGWWTQSRLELVLICLAAALLAAGVSLAVTAAGRQYLARHAGRICLLELSVLCALGLSELALEPWLQGGSPRLCHRRQPGMHRTFRPEPGAFPGIVGDSTYTTNALGIRGPELPPRPDAYRILCVGGSTTECAYLDDRETWPHLLMEHLNQSPGAPRVWVGNQGITGFGTRQHLRLLQESALLKEIDFVVLLVGVNDLGGFLRRPAGMSHDAVSSEELAPLWTRARLLALVHSVWVRYSGTLTEDAAGRNYVLRRRDRQQASVLEPLPDLTQGLAEYRQRLCGMVAALRQKGVVPVFLTQPTLWDEDLPSTAEELLWLRPTDKAGHYFSVAALRQGMDRYNEVLQSMCDTLGVTCIDLRPVQGRVELFYDDCHLNEAGAREIARLVTPGLASELRLLASRRKTREAQLARAGRRDAR